MSNKKTIPGILCNFPSRYFAMIVLLILSACANPVAPTGGPRDTEPPVILQSEPENGSVNFAASEIRLTFNEYVQIKNLSQQFLSSPPFIKTPETRLQGKSLVIKLTEELRPKTTYTLFFGNAISDFNEGNPLDNYRFVFSTGAVLDSMELKGKVLNAKTLLPEKEVFVMLYDSYEDSIPMLERPYYISRTNDKGDFTFTNLRDIPYKIFALRDVNANLIYDQPNEEIAFLETEVYPNAPVRPQIADTLSEVDTLVQEKEYITVIDTVLLHHPEDELSLDLDYDKKDEYEVVLVERDSLVVQDTIAANDSLDISLETKSLTLFLFNEVDSTQRLMQSEYLHPNKLQFIFRFPVKGLSINPIPPIEEEWKITENSSNSDTITYWIMNFQQDSIAMEVIASRMETDTVRIALTQMQTYRADKQSDTTKTWLDIKSNLPRSGPLDIHQPIKLTFNEPVDSFDLEKILLLEDSIRVEPEIQFIDEVKRLAFLSYKWKDSTMYDLLIPDSTFVSIFGHSNDTLQQSFKTKMQSDYGNLVVNLAHSFSQGQLIVDLLDEKGVVMQQKIIGLEQKQIRFSFLNPVKYQVKLTHDINSNNKWDTGAYPAHQPERVYVFDKTLELRANWDLEETFTIPGN
ncbi:MAG: Ig-like domain-containing protein [Bacteroidales bacterium]|nr:Ig-like domain-containing protein [Bacteroidales bacterium]